MEKVMGGQYYDRGDRPEFGKTGRRKKYKTPAPQKLPPLPILSDPTRSGADKFKAIGRSQKIKAPPISLAALQRHAGKLMAPRESNVVHGPTAEERFRQAASARMDEKLAREKTFMGRMQNRKEDVSDSYNRFSGKVKAKKDRAVGGIADAVARVKGGANKAWDTAKVVGGGIKRFGEGVYGVGRDAVKLAGDIGGGIANAYRGARKTYKTIRDGFRSAKEMAEFMASDASAKEKVQRATEAAGAAGEMGHRAVEKGADIAIGAAKGAYKNYVPKEYRKTAKKYGKKLMGAADVVGDYASRGMGWLSKYL
jgi:hypothetical protein